MRKLITFETLMKMKKVYPIDFAKVIKIRQELMGLNFKRKGFKLKIREEVNRK